ncbi:DNA-processing protein DprA [Sporomusa termitida]|uniref:DprA: DNA protecting protein DprA n=1 Tax=Sporomusa termitida TaxID=2377 RepID=A0A517DT06_9FIRM|nr:DNA-processing protein DprA [Sporomusa termitida]QDR80477.1 dprA: DNA protecting protein DprA [Sporomusa termitida]
MEQYYLAALQKVPGIGSSRIKALVDYFGSARQAWLADQGDLFLSRCVDNTVCNNLLAHRDKLDVHNLAELLFKKRIFLCSLTNDNYPVLLRNTFNPPYVLYYRGILPNHDKLVAIVGARKASPYGRNAAGMLAAALATAQVGIVSGAARGIDTTAHQGALEQGYTIAVLGCGVDISYPPENARLLARIAETGAIISEYAPGVMAQARHFPARNRIISGLSRGVIVVEAAERSGALITADFALEEGRDVFAVPGSIFAGGSKGTNRLIKQGAKLVDGAGDVLEEYGWEADPLKPAGVILAKDEQAVYSLLNYEEPIGIEEIVTKLNVLPATAAYILLQLTLRGLTVEHSGQCYTCAAREGNK